MKYTKFIGLDVHKETISVATIYPEQNEATFLGTISNDPDAINKLVKKLGDDPKTLKFCYEAGPCGYHIYWQLIKAGASCIVAAPSLIPTKPGDRIKTDKRDAKKLARLLKNSDITSVWVPDPKQEALRDLIRAREDANEDLLRKRNQLSKFLLRLNIRHPEKVKPWTVNFRNWLGTVRFEEDTHQFVLTEYIYALDQITAKIKRFDGVIEEAVCRLTNQKIFKALQALRGIGLITAATLVSELGDISRFKSAKQLMAYVGLTPGEHSSGDTRRQGRITKTGNAHVRRVIVESSWHYRYNPTISLRLKKRQQDISEEVKTIAWKAQHRLHHKYRKMLARGKTKQVTIVSIGRELLGFIWAIAVQIHKESLAA